MWSPDWHPNFIHTRTLGIYWELQKGMITGNLPSRRKKKKPGPSLRSSWWSPAGERRAASLPGPWQGRTAQGLVSSLKRGTFEKVQFWKSKIGCQGHLGQERTPFKSDFVFLWLKFLSWDSLRNCIAMCFLRRTICRKPSQIINQNHEKHHVLPRLFRLVQRLSKPKSGTPDGPLCGMDAVYWYV